MYNADKTKMLYPYYRMAFLLVWRTTQIYQSMSTLSSVSSSPCRLSSSSVETSSISTNYHKIYFEAFLWCDMFPQQLYWDFLKMYEFATISFLWKLCLYDWEIEWHLGRWQSRSASGYHSLSDVSQNSKQDLKCLDCIFQAMHVLQPTFSKEVRKSWGDMTWQKTL